MELEKGQQCASCVYYPENQSYSWIITRIEQVLDNGDFVVRDEFAENTKYDKYTVKSNRVTQFPSTDTSYKAGDRVLALWYDEETKEWSTMFYEAFIKEAELNDKVTVVFPGSTIQVEIDSSKLARFPKDFDLMTDNKSGTFDEFSCHEVEKPKDGVYVNRRLRFTNISPDDMQKIEPFTDEEFTRLIALTPPLGRLHSTEGTPLLNILEDPDLFPINSPHVTTNGSLVLTGIKSKSREPALLDKNNTVKIGRLTKIIREWR